MSYDIFYCVFALCVSLALATNLPTFTEEEEGKLDCPTLFLCSSENSKTKEWSPVDSSFLAKTRDQYKYLTSKKMLSIQVKIDYVKKVKNDKIICEYDQFVKFIKKDVNVRRSLWKPKLAFSTLNGFSDMRRGNSTYSVRGC